MRRRDRRILLVAPLLTAGLLAACSGSPAEGDKTAEAEVGPLSTYFESFYGGDLSQEEQQAQFDEQNKATEELVAQCMSEQGFEYLPNTSNSSISFEDDDVVYEPDDREWVAQYGYGAVNSPYNQGSEDEPPAEEYVDPNADYVASLSESEQMAFNEALYGPSPTEEEMAAMEDGDGGEWDWTKSGCYGSAQHETQGEDPLQADEFKSLNEAINSFYEGQPSWPGQAELDAAWSDCMSEAGHSGFAVQWDAQNSIYDEQNKIYEETSDPETGEIDQAAMDALGEKEIDLALADLDCREQTDYRQKVEDITFEQEQQFVDDHKAELDAMKAAAEQGN